MKAGNAADFILEYTGRNKIDQLSITFWEMNEACYVRVAERVGCHKSYLGLKELECSECGETCRVGDKDVQEPGVWLQFKIKRV